MTDSVIYYPYINVPESEWLVRTLLYWDDVYSIVPSELVYYPDKLNAFMGDLVNHDLVKPIMPMNYIRKIPRFNESFINLLNKKSYSRPFTGKLTLKNTARIHVEKMDYISKELVRRKLAKIDTYPWYLVEKETADLFMAYLACVIGNCTNNIMEPITDQETNLSIFNNRYELSKQESDFIKMRWSVLESVLPGPTGKDFDAKKIAEFKENNSNLAYKYRLYIEKTLIDISLIENENMKNRRFELFMEEVYSEVEELKLALEDYWNKIRWGTVWSVIPPSINFSASIAIGNWVDSIKYLPSLVHAIVGAFNSESNIQKRILEKPLVYAAISQKLL